MKTKELYSYKKPEGGLAEIPNDRAHRVIEDIPNRLPEPSTVLKTILTSPGWPYKVNRDAHVIRDRAFVSLVYTGALRNTEVCRKKDGTFSILRSQLRYDPNEGCHVIEGVKLVKEKTVRKGKAVPRKHAYRDKVFLPAEGTERYPFTQLILRWAEQVPPEMPLFKFKRARAWQIVRAMTGEWCHYFRVLGENYLYRAWRYDVIKLAEYLQVHPRTLLLYLKGDYSGMPKV